VRAARAGLQRVAELRRIGRGIVVARALTMKMPPPGAVPVETRSRSAPATVTVVVNVPPP